MWGRRCPASAAVITATASLSAASGARLKLIVTAGNCSSWEITKRSGGVLQLRNGAQRHLGGALGREQLGGGCAGGQRGLGGGGLDAGGRHIELGERTRIALILRHRLQDHPVLVRLGVNGRKSAAARRHRQACPRSVCIETPSRLAVSRSTCTIMRRPLSCASEATSRSTGEAAQLLGQAFGPVADLVGVGSGQRVLELGAAAAGGDLDVLHRLEIHDRCPGTVATAASSGR